jgi:aminopeptidase N
MIINSDERQWTWMDEGLNSFTEYLTEELWDNKFPTSRGPAYKIINYMKMPKDQLEPIMTNSENIVQFGANAYGKPATGLNIMRETIMGRELFDYSFKEYARRWAFKHPEPADFFRTMEDASAVDLDWFWKGWFYGIEPCDISLDSVVAYRPVAASAVRTVNDTFKIAKPILNDFEDLAKVRNRQDTGVRFYVDTDTAVQDFYYKYDRGMVRVDTTPTYGQRFVEPTDAASLAPYANKWYYQLNFTNKGGLVMPIILEFTFNDSTKQTVRIAAEIWRRNEKNTSKVFVMDKQVASVRLDPMRETADIDETNNNWPMKAEPSRFEIYKAGVTNARNPGSRAPSPMQKQLK